MKENEFSQRLVLSILRGQEADEMVDERLLTNEFVADVKKEIKNIQLRGSSAAAKQIEEQAETIRYLQSQREENDLLFADQQRELEQSEMYVSCNIVFVVVLLFFFKFFNFFRKAKEAEERVMKLEKENQALNQSLGEAKSIISQNIEKPLTDDRETEIAALREKLNTLSDNNVELQKKVLLVLFESPARDFLSFNRSQNIKHKEIQLWRKWWIWIKQKMVLNLNPRVEC